MASRGKKKAQARGGQVAVVEVAKVASDNRWVAVTAVVLVLLTVFLFFNSFTVQADLEYEDEDGNNLLEDLDPDQLRFGKSAITVIFAPVGGYDGAIEFTLQNLPLSKDSTIVQDIAKQLVADYPQSKLELLDTAYLTIYVTETVYLAATIAFIVAAIVLLVRRKKGDDVAALVACSVMTLLGIVRLVLGLVMSLNSTNEFVITAGGAPWLSLIASVAATVLLAVFVSARVKKEKSVKTEKSR